MIQKYQENHVEFREDWRKVMIGVPLENVKLLGIGVEEFYKLHPMKLKFQYSPLHISANQESYSHFEFIHKRTGSINP